MAGEPRDTHAKQKESMCGPSLRTKNKANYKRIMLSGYVIVSVLSHIKCFDFLNYLKKKCVHIWKDELWCKGEISRSTKKFKCT